MLAMRKKSGPGMRRVRRRRRAICPHSK